MHMAGTEHDCGRESHEPSTLSPLYDACACALSWACSRQPVRKVNSIVMHASGPAQVVLYMPALPAVCLQVMKKMKGSKNLDARQRMLLDDSAYACVPPVHMAARAKARPPVQAYMRHLVLHRLWLDDPKKVGLLAALLHQTAA